MEKHPRLGVGVYIIKGDLVLMGKRIGPHGTGTWSAPGGWLEFGEEWDQCASRETQEETGIKIKNIRFGWITNDISENDDKHVVTIHMVADYDSGEPEILEANKWESWGWFSWDDLPHPLFYPYKNLLAEKFDPRKI